MPGDSEMKFIIWSVAGRVKMLPIQIKCLVALQPDINTLQEVTKTTAPLFKELLPTLGLKHIVSTFCHKSFYFQRIKKIRITDRLKIDISNPEIGGELIKWPERLLSGTSIDKEELIYVNNISWRHVK
jgi:hypothetical protein